MGAGLIEPYGGRLVNRVVDVDTAEHLLADTADAPELVLRPSVASDLYLLAVGALSPLEGFMDEETYESVLDNMALPSGLPWSVPVVLSATEGEADGVEAGGMARLRSQEGEVLAVLEITSQFRRNLERERIAVYGTADSSHPGVAAIERLGDLCIGGSVHYLASSFVADGISADEILTPAQTRARFAELGWTSAVAFQTRNPIHRAHEYLQKCALEVVDGLLVHPVIGETKSDDVPADVRMECYRVLLDRYFPPKRVVLSALPLSMRYAGPMEAVFHAIIRRNYGCTHMIVGRDHAGVGDYYGTYDAQRVFDRVDPNVLGIRPLKFEHAFWCKLTGQMATEKTSPAEPEQRIFLSGTRLREMLSRGEPPPPEFTRPEVAEILLRAYARG